MHANVLLVPGHIVCVVCFRDGYPDADYLDKLQEDLRLIGIEESMLPTISLKSLSQSKH